MKCKNALFDLGFARAKRKVEYLETGTEPGGEGKPLSVSGITTG